MAEVRFKIKGQEQEIVFSPIVDENGAVYLYAKQSNGEKRIPLTQDPETKVFTLADYSVFDENPEVIEERLLGLSGEWMDEQAQGFESETKEDTIEPGTETLSLTADPREDGLVKSRTGDTTDATTYANWYKSVYLPAAAQSGGNGGNS